MNKTLDLVDKAFYELLIILCIIITGSFIIFGLNSHTEKLEWSFYIISSISTILIIVSLSTIVTRYGMTNKIQRTTIQLFALIFGFLLWFLHLQSISGISNRYFELLALGFIPAITGFVYQKKNNSLLISGISIIEDRWLLFRVILVNMLGIFVVSSFFCLDLGKYSRFGIIMIVIVTLLFYGMIPTEESSSRNPDNYNTIFSWVYKITFVVLFGFVIFLWLQRPVEYESYSFYLGPAFDIANGKSLLYDTPSQYGYLSIYFLAMLLKVFGFFLNIFNYINIFMFTVLYVCFYLVIKKIFKDWRIQTIFTFIIISLQTLFSYHNVAIFPSTGPLRFCFGLIIFALLLCLDWDKSLVFGNVISSVALFWSAETAIYIVPAWLFVSSVTILKNNSFKEMIKNLIQFISISGLIFGLIILNEFRIIHTWPHFMDFFQYASAYSNGFGALPIPVFGNYYLAIVILVLGLTLSFISLMEKNKFQRLPALLFLSVHNLAVFSYFISRSHENNIVNIFPFFVLQIGVIYLFLTKELNITWQEIRKYCLIPAILFSILFFGRSFDKLENTYSIARNNLEQNIKGLTVLSSPSLQEILRRKYNVDTTKIVVLSSIDTKILVENNIKNYVPLDPAIMTFILPNWKDKYVNPAVDKLTPGTIVITDSKIENENLNYVFREIQTKYNMSFIGTFTYGISMNLYRIN